ncbi:hypothetical protein L1987_70932 [Smallanthus sonchifolius]|uniref:Uncharacterized protein n=1 Tax=Smallanthus sonchifolius TaxID=185202 RepID=A0ACB9ARC4_9ASTR|nr:hypothetical protein L1987_70932 [Smallanthus sonchifolius]
MLPDLLQRKVGCLKMDSYGNDGNGMKMMRYSDRYNEKISLFCKELRRQRKQRETERESTRERERERGRGVGEGETGYGL